ncbi:hypothetical protein BAE44_0000346 [Dichanthelium oligosanthes]|uniref:Nuclease HARBI1 n=1 Tax=Dichanthelium oligosanthes TaxID=888268 RepID=A0A1E5WMK6_9POAL|nr:hypothetical protein BAE44_0000346 [Dichanthelium oligosanthes]
MSHQSDTSSCSDDSEDRNTIEPAGIYTMEELIAEHSVLHNLLERISVKIRAKIKARQVGTSRRLTGYNRRVIERDHGEGHQRLVADFFSEDPVYNEKIFRTRYRMSRPLFLRIVRALGEWSPYFTKRKDVCYRQGLSPLQKGTAAIRMLARGSPADAVDEYVQIGASTAMECLERFAEGVIDKFGGEYLRGPTSVDMQRLLQIGEGCGFPGMLGSIGCMHWEWENCPPKWMCHLNHSDQGFATRATLGKILQACVILHNMAVEDEKDMASAYFEPNEASGITAVLPSNIKTGPASCLTNVLQRSATICSQPTHVQQKMDLIEHIWQQFGPFGDK